MNNKCKINYNRIRSWNWPVKLALTVCTGEYCVSVLSTKCVIQCSNLMYQKLNLILKLHLGLVPVLSNKRKRPLGVEKFEKCCIWWTKREYTLAIYTFLFLSTIWYPFVFCYKNIQIIIQTETYDLFTKN